MQDRYKKEKKRNYETVKEEVAGKGKAIFLVVMTTFRLSTMMVCEKRSRYDRIDSHTFEEISLSFKGTYKWFSSAQLGKLSKECLEEVLHDKHHDER